MDWKGALRSMSAVARASQREAERRARAHQKYQIAPEPTEALQQYVAGLSVVS